jgi:hypothetical protein
MGAPRGDGVPLRQFRFLAEHLRECVELLAPTARQGAAVVR